MSDDEISRQQGVQLRERRHFERAALLFDGSVEAARRFALEAHGDQRYGAFPYEKHLQDVWAILYERWYDLPLQQAAWLHDVEEDTQTSRHVLQEQFGSVVEDMVWAVTGIGETRGERNASAYQKIAACPRAAALKLADRIANVEASVALVTKVVGPGVHAKSSLVNDRVEALRFHQMYQQEYPGFKKALWPHCDDVLLWHRLELALGGFR